MSRSVVLTEVNRTVGDGLDESHGTRKLRRFLFDPELHVKVGVAVSVGAMLVSE